MFEKIKAYPNGIVEYHYKDKVVVEGKDCLPIVTRKYDKELHGPIRDNNIIRGDFIQPSID